MRIVGNGRKYQHSGTMGVLMRSILTVLLAGCALVACASDNRETSNPVADEAINGEAAYEENCAGCHEDGVFAAPRVGVPQDWESRSSLWQAVLMEHAKQGFFEMPARGGKASLPDEVVNAAAEYMLEKTFSDRPKD